MSEKKVVAGLEEKAERVKRAQTPEVRAEIEAGIEKLAELGMDEQVLAVLRSLAPSWNSGDAEELKEAKVNTIGMFGEGREGSEAFKDFLEGKFKEALTPYAGIVRLIPISNNIQSFYARRQGKSKTAMARVNIGGVPYDVDAEYLASIANKSTEEKRELLLGHASTKKASIVEVVEL